MGSGGMIDDVRLEVAGLRRDMAARDVKDDEIHRSFEQFLRTEFKEVRADFKEMREKLGELKTAQAKTDTMSLILGRAIVLIPSVIAIVISALAYLKK